MYILFHLFIISLSSFHGFITNQLNDLLPVGLLAQYTVEHCTSSKVKGWNPAQAWIFFRFCFRNCRSCIYNCNDPFSFNSWPCSSSLWYSFISYFIVFHLLEFPLPDMIFRTYFNCAITYFWIGWNIYCNGHVSFPFRNLQALRTMMMTLKGMNESIIIFF